MKQEAFDVLQVGLPVVFCGINPSVRAADTGHNFGSASNRFWRALHQSGFTPMQLRAEDDRSILQFGCGLTAAATRGTRSAAELTSAELHGAIEPFRQKMEHYHPGTIAFLGKPAFAVMSGRSTLTWGPQPVTLAGARVWVLPNPSGLNRTFTLAQLVAAYAALRVTVAAELDAWRERGRITPGYAAPYAG